MTAIRLQDPEADDPAYLLEAILAVVREASSGGALFAFASRDGIHVLLEDPDFKAFLDRGAFRLVVGVDAITNLAALDALTAVGTASPHLSASVFLHDRNTIFHPKVCWFATNDGGVAFVGSGNLTVGGLAGNWEAYAGIDLSFTDVTTLRTSWAEWEVRHDRHLFDPQDEAVRARAAQNRARPRPSAAPRPPVVEEPAVLAQEILLAEIPRGSDRWKQANFDIATFRGFFGADPRASHRLILWRLNPDGSVAGIETRPTVSVRSHNYRVELDAASGLAYPVGDERPIGAFLRVSVRQFRYVLLMPGDADYGVVQGLLTRGAGPRVPNHMRRRVFSHADVEASWPSSPLLVAPEDETEPDEMDEA